MDSYINKVPVKPGPKYDNSARAGGARVRETILSLQSVGLRVGSESDNLNAIAQCTVDSVHLTVNTTNKIVFGRVRA